MKSLSYILMFSAFTLLFACEPKTEQVDWKAGTNLLLQGPSNSAEDVLFVGQSAEYHVNGYDHTANYTWTVSGAGASGSFDKNTGAYVVTSTEPGTMTVSVSKDGGLKGSVDIDVVTDGVGFVAKQVNDSVFTYTKDYMEKVESDTFRIPLYFVSGGKNPELKVSYSISASGMTAGTDYVDMGGGMRDLADSSADVPVVIAPNLTDDPARSLTLTITSVTSGLTDAASIIDTAKTITYNIMNNYKKVSFANPDTVVYNDSVPGTYDYEVAISADPEKSGTIAYTIAGTGYTNGTPDGTFGGGTLSFDKGETSKTITLTLNTAAFVADQDIVISLTSITSSDGEVILASSGVKKVIHIDTGVINN